MSYFFLYAEYKTVTEIVFISYSFTFFKTAFNLHCIQSRKSLKSLSPRNSQCFITGNSDVFVLPFELRLLVNKNFHIVKTWTCLNAQSFSIVSFSMKFHQKEDENKAVIYCVLLCCCYAPGKTELTQKNLRNLQNINEKEITKNR